MHSLSKRIAKHCYFGTEDTSDARPHSMIDYNVSLKRIVNRSKDWGGVRVTHKSYYVMEGSFLIYDIITVRLNNFEACPPLLGTIGLKWHDDLAIFKS